MTQTMFPLLKSNRGMRLKEILRRRRENLGFEPPGHPRRDPSYIAAREGKSGDEMPAYELSRRKPPQVPDGHPKRNPNSYDAAIERWQAAVEKSRSDRRSR